MSTHSKPTTESVMPPKGLPLAYVVITPSGRRDIIAPNPETAAVHGKVIGYLNTRGGVTAL